MYNRLLMVRPMISPTLVHYFFHYPFTAAVALFLAFSSGARSSGTADRIVRFWAAVLFRSMGLSIEVSGKEFLNDRENRLIVANHASLFDIPAVLSLVPALSFIGRSKLLSIPVFSPALKCLQYIPIDPLKLRQSIEALDSGVSGISKGRSIFLFPEGTRTLNGEILPFRRGFVRILRKSGADLQPVTLNGFYRLKSKYSRIIDGSTVLSITFHPPIGAEILKTMDDREIMDTARKMIQSAYWPDRKSE